jgi:DNA-directed primase/polymerase protein
MNELTLPVLDASKFYTSNDSTWWQQRQQLATRRRRVTTSSSCLWLEFARQASAFATADSLPRSDTCCFAFTPADLSATYRYIVSTYADFWSVYRRLAPEARTHYEVIRADHVCNLYFDVEFKFAEHAGISAEQACALLRALKAHVAALLRTDVSGFCELDASTSTKFSRHLVLRSPTVCFTSAVAVGVWVKRMLADAPEFAWFIDQGVYTRNRLMRLYLSTKLGRAAPLVLAAGAPGGSDDEAVFLASLVTNVAALATPVAVAVDDEKPAPVFVGGVPAPLSVPASKSPFAAIDDFIAHRCHLVRNGFVRSSVYFPTTRVVVFEIGGTRFCHRIGREHKSNHVYVVVELLRLVFTQRCHDHECRGYRSSEFPLPPELDPFASADDDGGVTDAELLDFAEQSALF